eukprot:TRINITY_DN1432_c0_g1_i2.p1 TRINITY_DN1432_c0_g1~~TRINITY_DN1432_c0_g1_i2.p1  ORF type:complete len:1178 (+),score=330.36 TRINITY_DN1432_c0_g1_i2:78-3611(+)
MYDGDPQAAQSARRTSASVAGLWYFSATAQQAAKAAAAAAAAEYAASVPAPDGEVRHLLEELSEGSAEGVSAGDYWVNGAFDLEALRADVAASRQAAFEGAEFMPSKPGAAAQAAAVSAAVEAIAPEEDQEEEPALSFEEDAGLNFQEDTGGLSFSIDGADEAGFEPLTSDGGPDENGFEELSGDAGDAGFGFSDGATPAPDENGFEDFMREDSSFDAGALDFSAGFQPMLAPSPSFLDQEDPFGAFGEMPFVGDVGSPMPDMDPGAPKLKVCPDCSIVLNWSDFAEGDYQDGWHCNNIDMCGRGAATSGPWRWFCSACMNDFCEDCSNALPPPPPDFMPSGPAPPLLVPPAAGPGGMLPPAPQGTSKATPLMTAKSKAAFLPPPRPAPVITKAPPGLMGKSRGAPPPVPQQADGHRHGDPLVSPGSSTKAKGAVAKKAAPFPLMTPKAKAVSSTAPPPTAPGAPPKTPAVARGKPTFDAGEIVEVFGLKAAAVQQYNGEHVTVRAMRDDGRVEVLLKYKGGAKVLALKSANLRLPPGAAGAVEDAPMDTNGTEQQAEDCAMQAEADAVPAAPEPATQPADVEDAHRHGDPLAAEAKAAAKASEPAKPKAPVKPPPWTEEEAESWAKRCKFKGEGSPTFSVSMAKAGLGDAGMVRWCQWLNLRLKGAIEATGSANVKAPSVDVSGNGLGAEGLGALLRLLETHKVRCAVVKLTDNAIDDAAIKELARYLASFAQAPLLELHLAQNKVSVKGFLWLLANLAMHPGYPIHDRSRMAYLPLMLRAEQNAMTAREAAALVAAALAPLQVVACPGQESQQCATARCCHMRAKGALKHNCIVHLCQFTSQGGKKEAFPALPAPKLHSMPLFDVRQAIVEWKEGDVPTLARDAEQRLEPQVLYEDADNIVLLKPAAWICTAAGVDAAAADQPVQKRRDAVRDLRAQANPAAFAQYLVLRYGAAAPLCKDAKCGFGLVFRHDLDTSGPVLAAKTKAGFETARTQMRSRDLVKDFLALVHGSMGAKSAGDVRGPIDDSSYEAQSICRVGPNGKDAITVYETIGEYSDGKETYSLLHLRLITGRTHQARVHMAHIAHPIVADSRYLGDANLLEKDKAWCPRLFLHMVRLGFCATNGLPVVTWSPLRMAPDLLQALAGLRPLNGAPSGAQIGAAVTGAPASAAPPKDP